MFKGILILLMFCCLSLIMMGQSEKINFSEERGLYKKIENITVSTAFGEKRLSELYSQKPLILTLVFSNCTGICSPSLLLLSENMMKAKASQDINILVLSFDPKDSLQHMEYLSQRLQLNNNPQWIFGITKNIGTITSQLAFEYTWDQLKQQFDHDALLVGINNDGYIVKKLVGVRDVHALNDMIAAAENKFIPSHPLPGSNNLFSCFSYNPQTGETRASYGLLVLLLPAILTFLIVMKLSYKKKITNN